jgi:hypothetical protein
MTRRHYIKLRKPYVSKQFFQFDGETAKKKCDYRHAVVLTWPRGLILFVITLHAQSWTYESLVVFILRNKK